MCQDAASPPPTCPDPHTRSPRAAIGVGIPTDSLSLPPAALQGALVALVKRDTRGCNLGSAQRLTHFAAIPLVTLSWFHGSDVGLIKADSQEWRSFGSRIVISGSQSDPCVSWAPTTGCGYMACFDAEAARALFEVDLATIQDRFLPFESAVGKAFAPLQHALLASSEADAMELLVHHLASRWQALQGRSASLPSLRLIGRNWVERLAWKAREWSLVRSPRQVERRIKAFSGRSLREWESLVRSEGLFFSARDRFETGQAFDWAALALDEGFADQAHMSRTAKRITGFAPTEFASRFIEDESFWMYRLWV